jgi:2-polyprenyl-6-hydroxyphenyl methylase/3-demethylubiquinone-9 3-methyltransferase
MKQLPLNPDWPRSVQECHHYDALEFWGDRSHLGYTYAYQNRFRIAIELVQRAAAPPAKILDLAAAQGNFTLRLAEMGYEVTWNDLRAELVDYVRQKYERGVVHYRPGNVFDLPSGQVGPFDVIVATEIIEHVAHPDQFLSKLASLVVPGGAIVLTTPNGGYFRNHLPRFSDCPDPSVWESVQFKPNADGHIFLLHVDEMYKLASAAGLRVQEMRLFNNSLTSGHVKTERLLHMTAKTIVGLAERTGRLLPMPLQRRLQFHMAVLLRR